MVWICREHKIWKKGNIQYSSIYCSGGGDHSTHKMEELGQYESVQFLQHLKDAEEHQRLVGVHSRAAKTFEEAAYKIENK